MFWRGRREAWPFGERDLDFDAEGAHRRGDGGFCGMAAEALVLLLVVVLLARGGERPGIAGKRGLVTDVTSWNFFCVTENLSLHKDGFLYLKGKRPLS